MRRLVTALSILAFSVATVAVPFDPAEAKKNLGRKAAVGAAILLGTGLLINELSKQQRQPTRYANPCDRYLRKADAAAERGDFEAEANWLDRYDAEECGDVGGGD